MDSPPRIRDSRSPPHGRIAARIRSGDDDYSRRDDDFESHHITGATQVGPPPDKAGGSHRA